MSTLPVSFGDIQQRRQAGPVQLSPYLRARDGIPLLSFCQYGRDPLEKLQLQLIDVQFFVSEHNVLQISGTMLAGRTKTPHFAWRLVQPLSQRVEKAFCCQLIRPGGISSQASLEQNAVKATQVATRFVQKFASLVIACLSCHDRLIFKGYLPFGGDRHLNDWVDHQLKIRRKDFIPQLRKFSEQLVQDSKQLAQEAGAHWEYLQGKTKKEKLIDGLLRERPHADGLVAVLCCQETCRSVQLRHAEQRPWLAFKRRQQRVLYYYYLDPRFGRRYVRIETWFPFTVQVYVNGHEWLARQMAQRGWGFVQEDNTFTQLDDPAGAQRLANGLLKIRWQGQLNRWAEAVNPLLKHPWFRRLKYRWVIDQAEYATDVIFRDPQSLQALYPRLLDHAAVNFSAQDIMMFLGRRLHWRFDGEVLTECKKDRWPGARIKHRLKGNWLKMYDKQGVVLRVETVINQSREFQVRRQRERKGKLQMVWCPMNKGIANLYQYQAAALAANVRYLEALSVVADPSPAYQHVDTLARPQRVEERSYAGFNPARREDVTLFQAILQGEHLLRGFRNADVRRRLHGETADRQQRRRQSAAVGRLLKRLHVRGLIAKIPHTRRWHVTLAGQQIMGACVQLYHHGLSNIAA